MASYEFKKINPSMNMSETGGKVIALQTDGKNKLKTAYENYYNAEIAKEAPAATPQVEQPVESLDIPAPVNTDVVNFEPAPANLDPNTPIDVEPFKIDEPVAPVDINPAPAAPVESNPIPAVDTTPSTDVISPVEFVKRFDDLVKITSFDEASRNLMRNQIRSSVALAGIVSDLNTSKLETMDLFNQVKNVQQTMQTTQNVVQNNQNEASLKLAA